MKKALITILALGLVATAMSPAMAKKHKPKVVTRTATADYTTPGGVAGVVSGTDNTAGENAGGVSFTTTSTEKYVVLSVADASGQPVAGTIGQDTTGDGLSDMSVDFCGKTAAPVVITPGTDVTVFINEGPCADGPGGVGFATTGTVTAVFSNSPNGAVLPSGS